MFKTLINKEFKAILTGPKFVFTFLITLLLLILSIYMGIVDYRSSVRSYEAGLQLSAEEMHNHVTWSKFSRTIYRGPDPLKIFISGITNDIGRYSNIDRTSQVKLKHSAYSDDPLFAVFRHLDFQGFVLIVLSLFAILFTYDAVSGEKETGTLRLTFSNPVPRLQYMAAKFVGITGGLLTPVFLSILISLLLVMAFNIPLTGQHWARILVMVVSSMLYFVFFIVLGLFVSCVTRKSTTSFLLLLVIWITLVLIIPRMGIMAASSMKPVPSVAELDAQIEGHSKQQWDTFNKQLEALWNRRNLDMQGLDSDERQIYQDDHMWQWIQEEDSLRKSFQHEISDFTDMQYNQYRNQKIGQERLGFTLSRISPAAALQLLLLNMAETDIHLKSRTELAMQDYKNILTKFIDNKEKTDDNMAGIRITVDSEAGFRLDMGRNTSLDISDVPEYTNRQQTISELLLPSFKEILIILLYTAISIGGAFIAFNRYDVR